MLLIRNLWLIATLPEHNKPMSSRLERTGYRSNDSGLTLVMHVTLVPRDL